jgi:hypothetical protein
VCGANGCSDAPPTLANRRPISVVSASRARVTGVSLGPAAPAVRSPCRRRHRSRGAGAFGCPRAADGGFGTPGSRTSGTRCARDGALRRSEPAAQAYGAFAVTIAASAPGRTIRPLTSRPSFQLMLDGDSDTGLLKPLFSSAHTRNLSRRYDGGVDSPTLTRWTRARSNRIRSSGYSIARPARASACASCTVADVC